MNYGLHDNLVELWWGCSESDIIIHRCGKNIVVDVNNWLGTLSAAQSALIVFFSSSKRREGGSAMPYCKSVSAFFRGKNDIYTVLDRPFWYSSQFLGNQLIIVIIIIFSVSVNMFESEGYCGTFQLLVLTVTQILATQLDPRVSLRKKFLFSFWLWCHPKALTIWTSTTVQQ